VLYYLPRTLRTELAMTLYEDTIRKAPMFKSMPKAMVQEIAVSLTAETALPGDWIFCAGDIGHDMVFLGHGRVEVCPTFLPCPSLLIRSSVKLVERYSHGVQHQSSCRLAKFGSLLSWKRLCFQRRRQPICTLQLPHHAAFLLRQTWGTRTNADGGSAWPGVWTYRSHRATTPP
jgi:hypothetical protein